MQDQRVIIIGADMLVHIQALPQLLILFLQESQDYSLHSASPRYILTQLLPGLDNNGFPDSALLRQKKISNTQSMKPKLNSILKLATGRWRSTGPSPCCRKFFQISCLLNFKRFRSNPFRPAPESNILPIINGDTGDEVAKLSLPKFHRCSRIEMTKLFAERLDVEFSSQSLYIVQSY